MNLPERMTFRLPSQQYEQYTAQAADHLVGQQMPVMLGLESLSGTIVAATVAQDRLSILVTLELRKPALERCSHKPKHGSVWQCSDYVKTDLPLP